MIHFLWSCQKLLPVCVCLCVCVCCVTVCVYCGRGEVVAQLYIHVCQVCIPRSFRPEFQRYTKNVGGLDGSSSIDYLYT